MESIDKEGNGEGLDTVGIRIWTPNVTALHKERIKVGMEQSPNSHAVVSWYEWNDHAEKKSGPQRLKLTGVLTPVLYKGNKTTLLLVHFAGVRSRSTLNETRTFGEGNEDKGTTKTQRR